MDLEHGSGSSKHSESHPEAIDGSGTSDHEDTYPKLRVRVGSSDNLQRDPEEIDGTESSKNSDQILRLLMEVLVVNKESSNWNLLLQKGSLHAICKVRFFFFLAFLAPSLSSSSSSLYDLFDVITKESSDPGACTDFESPNKPHEITQPASQDHENDTSIDNSHKSKETFPVSDVNLESLVHDMSPTQSPPVQVMERPGGYDPFRIPSSIFESNKGPAPMDWSVASNESLFSIHVGNNSFSRDHKSGELIMFSPPPPKAMVATDNQSSDPAMGTHKQKGGANGVADNTIKDPAEFKNEENKPIQAVSWKSPRASRLSYESGDSVESFSFPIPDRNDSGLGMLVFHGFVAGRSATVNGQAATLGGQAARVLIVAGRSATIGNVAEKDGAVINIPCMLLSLPLY
ncbi:protein AF [Salix suchowensis]|nr:protein AF [Salix suchowensis]